MKDVTSTSFGLLIAFLLPGLAALYALSLYFDPIKSQLSVFLSAESNVGLFLLVVLTALILGLQVTLIRWFIYEIAIERIILRRDKLPKEAFAALGQSGYLSAFRAATDEYYRYHQFWGGMSIVVPIMYFGFRLKTTAYSDFAISGWGLLSFLVVEVLTLAGALDAYRNYIERARDILHRGEGNGERLAKEDGKKDCESAQES
jgi:hypothetical protein